MAETAAHLVEHVLPEQPIRQWVLSFPYPLRFLLATRPAVLTQVLGIVYRAVSTFLVRRAGLRVGAGACTGAVTLIQRFGIARSARAASPRAAIPTGVCGTLLSELTPACAHGRMMPPAPMGRRHPMAARPGCQPPWGLVMR